MILALLAPLAMQAVDPIAGVWRGSSICQVRHSACNDEQAVYHVTKDAQGGGYTFVGNKLVAGVEVPMGVIRMTFNPATVTLTGIIQDRAQRPLTWVFMLHGNRMSGRLTAQDGTVLRLVEVARP